MGSTPEHYRGEKSRGGVGSGGTVRDILDYLGNGVDLIRQKALDKFPLVYAPKRDKSQNIVIASGWVSYALTKNSGSVGDYDMYVFYDGQLPVAKTPANVTILGSKSSGSPRFVRNPDVVVTDNIGPIGVSRNYVTDTRRSFQLRHGHTIYWNVPSIHYVSWIAIGPGRGE